MVFAAPSFSRVPKMADGRSPAASALLRLGLSSTVTNHNHENANMPPQFPRRELCGAMLSLL
jgi:hypothetical protein